MYCLLKNIFFFWEERRCLTPRSLSTLMRWRSIFGEFPWAQRNGLSLKPVMLGGPWTRAILHNACEQSPDEGKETPKAAGLSQLFFNQGLLCIQQGQPRAVWPIQERVLPVSSSHERKACLENLEQFYFLISAHQEKKNNKQNPKLCQKLSAG